MSHTVPNASTWIGLCIGNSRLHWALWTNDALCQTWHTPHLQPAFQPFLRETLPHWSAIGQYSPAFQACAECDPGPLPELWIASVVPAQTALWAAYPNLTVVTLDDIPIPDLYSTLGIDRAIALLGAGDRYGWPVLVLDGGTALTLTGADAAGRFIGGAILPGLQLQMRSLQKGTAQLPCIELPEHLPDLWAKDTVTALQSGILNTTIAGLSITIGQWCQAYPNSSIICTGGDAPKLSCYLTQWQQRYPTMMPERSLQTDLYLMFCGLFSLRQRGLAQSHQH